MMTYMKTTAVFCFFALMMLCACHSATAGMSQTDTMTPQEAYEGVSNYCHSEYDWSPAENDSTTMYVAMGDETDAEYKVIFRSYTGAFVYFYVNKASGKARMVEHVPFLDIDNEVGTSNIRDYLKKKQ